MSWASLRLPGATSFEPTMTLPAAFDGASACEEPQPASEGCVHGGNAFASFHMLDVHYAVQQQQQQQAVHMHQQQQQAMMHTGHARMAYASGGPGVVPSYDAEVMGINGFGQPPAHAVLSPPVSAESSFNDGMLMTIPEDQTVALGNAFAAVQIRPDGQYCVAGH